MPNGQSRRKDTNNNAMGVIQASDKLNNICSEFLISPMNLFIHKLNKYIKSVHFCREKEWKEGKKTTKY